MKANYLSSRGDFNSASREIARQEIEKYKKTVCVSCEQNIANQVAAVMCRALALNHGFGKKRLCDIMDRMNTIMLETFTTADAVQKVYKQLGLRFSEEDPFHWLNYEEDEAL